MSAFIPFKDSAEISQESMNRMNDAIKLYPDFKFPDELCDQMLSGGTAQELVNFLLHSDDEKSGEPLKVLLTLSAFENGANRLVELPSPVKSVHVLFQHMMFSSFKVSNIASMVLCNISRDSSTGLSEVVLCMKPYKDTIETLINRFIRDRNEEHNYIPMLICNLSADINVRSCLISHDNDFLDRLLPYISMSDSHVVREAVMGVIRNCTFHSEAHEWLLRETNVLYFILLPLIRSEELREEHKEFPSIIQNMISRKKPEESSDIRRMALEALYKLCRFLSGRKYIRDSKTYEVLREYHLWETNEENLELCEDVVNVIIRTEDEFEMPDLEKPNEDDNKVETVDCS